LWLVPLLALARPRWRLALIWQFAEVAVWFLTLTELLGFDTPSHGVPYGAVMIAVLTRDVLLLALAGLMIREMWRPELDIVRSAESDDPAGRELDNANDYPFAPLFTFRTPSAPVAG